MANFAKWIKSPVDTGSGAVTFRRAFSPKGAVRSAVVRASAVGVYAFYLNGKRVGNGVLAPGWTSYPSRIQYQTYDVTALLKKNNRLEFGVGQGWAVGFMGYSDHNHGFSDHVALVARLDVEYEDGSKESVKTDRSWDAYTSQVLSSEIYHGETVDRTARVRKLGAALPDSFQSELIPQMGEWITEHEQLAPVKVIHTPKGETVLDFGQNMTGYVRLRICGPRGSRVVLHHAEVLDREGNFYTANLRKARNENVYVLSGKEDVFQPTYSFQGFRYVRLTEFPPVPVDPDAFRAVAVHSDLKRTGHFNCGNEKINQLYHNIIWGQKSNYLDIPTDCPQRDERLGWTGDAQIFCRTAAINYDVERFFRKWLADVALEQGEDGAVYGVVPVCAVSRRTRISAAWGDVACVAPWQMWVAYGDKELLRQNFPMMKKWVDYMHSAGPKEFLWLGGKHYGDWLAMDAGEDSYVGATCTDLIASAYFAYSCSLVVKAGHALGEDVSDYEELHRNVVKAFRRYFMKDGMPKAEFPVTEQVPEGGTPADTKRKGMTQTALTLILHFGLCTEKERKPIADRLVQMIRENGGLMSTGFVGTPYLLHALADNGYADVAYGLLYQEKNPSWLYSVCHGATTMWEHWNSLKEDGTFWSADMNSFNHYAYGAVCDWLFGVAAGIVPSEEHTGYAEVTLAPHPDRNLGFLEASVDTRRGTVRTRWYYKGDDVYYEFDVPAGVTAHLRLPGGTEQTLSGGSYLFAEVK